VSRNSIRRKQESNSRDSEKPERARIIAAFMGLLVEQSIKKIDFGQIAAGTDASLAQLREEFGSTIAVLAAHVEQIDRLVLADENVEMAERAHGLAMLLTLVLRTWLDGEDPDVGPHDVGARPRRRMGSASRASSSGIIAFRPASLGCAARSDDAAPTKAGGSGAQGPNLIASAK
jgi:AcrR family transcriptional regulator